MWLELIIGWLAIIFLLCWLNKRFWDAIPDHADERERLVRMQRASKVIE